MQLFPLLLFPSSPPRRRVWAPPLPAPGAPKWTGSTKARPAPREDKPCEKPPRAQCSGSGPPRGWRFRWAQRVSDSGRLQTGLEDTLGSSPMERGPVGWPPICSWGLSRTQKGMGSRAQGAGLGPEAGRRGQAGWWPPGPWATAAVHACGSVLCRYRAGLTTSPGFRRLQCVTGTLRWGGGCWAHLSEAQGWASWSDGGREQPEVGGRSDQAWSQRFGTLLSQHLPLFNSCFQQGFSLSSPTNQAKGGVRSGKQDTGPDLQGLFIVRHSE